MHRTKFLPIPGGVTDVTGIHSDGYIGYNRSETGSNRHENRNVTVVTVVTDSRNYGPECVLPQSS